MPPPEEVAELLLKVLLLMATVALPGPPENPGEAWFQMPPPVPLMPADLPFTVLVLTVRAALPSNWPSLRMPPPAAPSLPLAESPLTVVLLAVRVAVRDAPSL